MDNEKLKNLPITTLLLTYLFVCGVLYLIGFWSIFDVDVFSLISIYDIPKNFAFPLLVSQGFFVLNAITGNVIHFNDDREDKNYLITIKSEWKPWKKNLLQIITSINLWVTFPIFGMLLYLPDYKHSEIFWSISSLLIAYFLLHKFVNIEVIKKNFKGNLLRFFIGHFLIFFPISCFSTGKISSLAIFKNKENKYVNIVEIKTGSICSDTTSVKLLGFISDRIIYCTLDNKKTYIINKDACDGILITKK